MNTLPRFKYGKIVLPFDKDIIPLVSKKLKPINVKVKEKYYRNILKKDFFTELNKKRLTEYKIITVDKDLELDLSSENEISEQYKTDNFKQWQSDNLNHMMPTRRT